MRDIEKDKEYVKYAGGFEELEWPLVMECCYIAQHYIDQYEATQARISELERMISKNGGWDFPG